MASESVAELDHAARSAADVACICGAPIGIHILPFTSRLSNVARGAIHLSLLRAGLVAEHVSPGMATRAAGLAQT